MEDPLEKIMTTLYGNSRPGLIERINKFEILMEALQESYHEDIKDIKANLRESRTKLEKLENYKIADEAKNEIKGSRKWYIGMLITSITSFLTAVAAVATLIIKL